MDLSQLETWHLWWNYKILEDMSELQIYRGLLAKFYLNYKILSELQNFGGYWTHAYYVWTTKNWRRCLTFIISMYSFYVPVDNVAQLSGRTVHCTGVKTPSTRCIRPKWKCMYEAKLQFDTPYVNRPGIKSRLSDVCCYPPLYITEWFSQLMTFQSWNVWVDCFWQSIFLFTLF